MGIVYKLKNFKTYIYTPIYYLKNFQRARKADSQISLQWGEVLYVQCLKSMLNRDAISLSHACSYSHIDLIATALVN